MDSTQKSKVPVGVVGSGTFGNAISNILAENQDVLLYVRRQEVYDEIKTKSENRGKKLNSAVSATQSYEELAEKCSLIFILVPSKHFRSALIDLSHHLRPDHLLIHGTKGLDVKNWQAQEFSKENIFTMSEVILYESNIKRVGVLSGPNLAGEMELGQPAAAVVASRFEEVIKAGSEALISPRFRIYGSRDVLGVEYAGTFKNVMAIASGALSGLGLGENARAMLITRGLAEVTRLGKYLGANVQAFLGLAGIGDILATCSSPQSRNFSVGYRLAKGETVDQILGGMKQVAEGVDTVKIAKGLSLHYQADTPLVDALYSILFEQASISDVIRNLMDRPFQADVDFL